MYPWLVDFHDQTTWEVEQGYEEEATKVFKQAYELLNSELNVEIPLKGDVELGDNLWLFKK